MHDFSVGQTFSTRLVDDLTRTQIVQYAGASGDYSPIHTDEVFATSVAGLETVLAHGMLTMGVTGRVVTELFGAQQLRRFGGRFTAPVRPGDSLVATAEIVAVRHEADGDHVELTVATVNQRGDVVFRGYAEALVAG